MNKSARYVTVLRVALFLAFGLVVLDAALPLAWSAGETAWKAPARAARKKNPVPVDAKSIAIGKAAYVRECLSCHGPAGKGDGPQAKDLIKSPGDLASPAMWEQTDGELFWKITEGSRPMPSEEKLLTEEERWSAVNYIRTLSPRPAESAPKPASSPTSQPSSRPASQPSAARAASKPT
jgi:mono/diheme cytochrome c family protein